MVQVPPSMRVWPWHSPQPPRWALVEKGELEACLPPAGFGPCSELNFISVPRNPVSCSKRLWRAKFGCMSHPPTDSLRTLQPDRCGEERGKGEIPGILKSHHELPILQTAAPRSRGGSGVTRSELGLEPMGLDLMTLKFADGIVQGMKPALLSHISSGRGTLQRVGSGEVRMGGYGLASI